MQKETKNACLICQYRDLLTRVSNEVLTIVVSASDGQSTISNPMSSSASADSLKYLCL